MISIHGNYTHTARAGHHLSPRELSNGRNVYQELGPGLTLLALDADELEAWTELRDRLAAVQGVELEERAASYHALHRLLGHPDTYAEGMELDAELVSRGVDLDDEPFADVSPEEESSAVDDWVLLLQISNDDDLALDLGDASRLFVWIRRDDLAAGRFDAVQAFVR